MEFELYILFNQVFKSVTTTKYTVQENPMSDANFMFTG